MVWRGSPPLFVSVCSSSTVWFVHSIFHCWSVRLVPAVGCPVRSISTVGLCVSSSTVGLCVLVPLLVCAF